MKYNPYSVSKIECYLQCPKKFEFQYIIKPKVKQSWFHLEKGKLWHKLIELKLQDKVNEFKKPKFNELTHKDYISELNNIKLFFQSNIFDSYRNPIWYNQKFEYYFCINEKFEQCKKKDGLILGYVDLLQICGGDYDIEIIDWKTGKLNKSYPKSTFQLDVYACVMRKLFNIDKITGKYVYVEHDYEQVKKDFDYDKIWNDVLNTIHEIENCKEFKHKDQILCNWCPYYDLCYNPNSL